MVSLMLSGQCGMRSCKGAFIPAGLSRALDHSIVWRFHDCSQSHMHATSNRLTVHAVGVD